MKNAKQLLAALAVIFVIATGCGSGGKPAPSNIDELDTAIRDASDYLNNNIPKGSKIVILNIQSGSPDLSDYIIDELLANAVNDKFFSVVDRQQLDAIRAEQNFQWSGEVDDDSAMEIGRFFGAQTIVSGAVGRLGSGYRMRIRALEVQTAQVQGQYNRNIASSPIIAALDGSGGGSPAGVAPAAASVATAAAAGSGLTISGLTISGLSAYKDSYVAAASVRDDLNFIAYASISNTTSTAARIIGDSVTLKVWVWTTDRGYVNYTGNDKNLFFVIYIYNREVLRDEDDNAPYRIARGTAVVNFTNGADSVNFTFLPAAPAAPAAQAYKIGDTGPAGGLIFYDKGNNNGGWRYLEAAPVEAEIQAVMSVRGTIVDNTQTTIGSGKRNTQLIVEKLKQTSGEWDTAPQKVDELVFGGFDDWFIPSRDELDQMYGNLKRRNLGDFKNETYFTSSYTNIYGSSYFCSQNFRNGSLTNDGLSSRNYVRPIRQVPGP